MPDAHPFTAGSQRALLEQLLSNGAVRRSAYLLAGGIRAQALADAVQTGAVIRAAPGVYHLPIAGGPSARIKIAVAGARAPKAVVCLLSAAYLCDLIDEASPTVWLAQPVGSHIPKPGTSPERILHWSYTGAFDVGVLEDEVCGVSLRRSDAPRTIVDLFRHARQIGDTVIGDRAGGRFVETGGSPSAVLDVAARLATPNTTMRQLTAAAERWRRPQTGPDCGHPSPDP